MFLYIIIVIDLKEHEGKNTHVFIALADVDATVIYFY